MWSSALIVFWVGITYTNTEDTCPHVKILGMGGIDKLTVLRGCPGIPGTPGQKGEPAISEIKGSKGDPGKVGPPGAKGDRGANGFAGIAGEKGQKGDTKPPERYTSKNCKELFDNGEILTDWYTIYPDGDKPLKVLCDMHTLQGGWIVFQRRLDGAVDFNRNWTSYKMGFGSHLGEFWLGNENLYKLTSNGTWELRIELRDLDNFEYVATYSSFKVLGETEKYKLVLGDFIKSNIGDSMKLNNNSQFSTLEQDNDGHLEKNCAQERFGGWWYEACGDSNLNSLYLKGNHSTPSIGINWNTANGPYYSYSYCEMKIRPL